MTQDVGLDMARLGDKMSASSLLATAASEPYRSSSRPRETAGDHDHARGVSLSEKASPAAGEDDGYCGLGEAGPEEEEEEEEFDGEGMDAQVGGGACCERDPWFVVRLAVCGCLYCRGCCFGGSDIPYRGPE